MSDDDALLDHVGRLAEMGLLAASWMHEVRQPLTAIQAAAELALAKGSPDAERWRTVLSQVRTLRTLVDHVSGLGRADGRPVRVDLARPVEAALVTLRAQARSARVTVSVALPEAPVLVRCPPSAVQQVVVNLVHNAIDAARQGGGHVWIDLQDDGSEAVITVDDDGPGVAPAIQGRLFEAFATDKPVGRGTGLGLYIVRGIVEDLGGTIALAPRYSRGTRAVLRLPRAA